MTLILRSQPGLAQLPAVQLRGMCVDPAMQHQGLGTRLFESALAPLALHLPQAHIIWCNARLSAQGFYEKLGFEPHGEAFDVENIGPHILMRRPAKIGRASCRERVEVLPVDGTYILHKSIARNHFTS